MATILGSLKVILELIQRPTTPYEGGLRVETNIDKRIGSGTTTGLVDKLYSRATGLATGANEDLDLQTLTDREGTAIALVDVRYLEIHNPSTNDGNLEFKGGAANGWCGAGFGITKDASDIVQIQPGTSLILDALSTDGKYVVDATHKVINVKNNGTGTVAYLLKIAGTSA